MKLGIKLTCSQYCPV